MDLGIRCNVSSKRNNHRPKNKTALKYLYLRGGGGGSSVDGGGVGGRQRHHLLLMKSIFLEQLPAELPASCLCCSHSTLFKFLYQKEQNRTGEQRPADLQNISPRNGTRFSWKLLLEESVLLNAVS